MVKDDRLYAKFTLDFADHPKIKPLSDAAFRTLVEMILYSRRMLTDGFISRRLVGEAGASWLLDACFELLHNDDEKPSLIEVDNGYCLRDFSEHQTTNADLASTQQARKRAGQMGGVASGRSRREAKLKQTRSKTKPETETETETEISTTPTGVVERTRAHRIPADWRPSDQTKAWARTNYSHLNLNDQYESFMDYWQAASGQTARKHDWDRTFKNWLRNSRGQPKRNNSTTDQRVAAVQALKVVHSDRLELP